MSWGPDLLFKEEGEVLPAPVLGLDAGVRRRAILLVDVGPTTGNLVHPGLDNSRYDIQVHLVLIFSPAAKMWGGMTLPWLLTTPSPSQWQGTWSS